MTSPHLLRLLRRVGVLSFVLCVVGTLPGRAATSSPPMPARPNVLVIMSDDLRTELGCYGVKDIRTPNIDQLAARSVRFERAYVQFPLCNPVRSSLLTGRYPTATGVLDNLSFLLSRHPDWLTLPMYFKQHGYTTLRTGKIFHGGFDDTDAWTQGGEPRPLGNTDRKGSSQDPTVSDSIIVLEGNGENHGDYKNATRGDRDAEGAARRETAVFLWMRFSKPHSPPQAPKKFYDLYPTEKIPLPADFAAKPTVPPGFPDRSVPPRNSDLFIGREASEKEAREVKRAYWASVSFLDEQVGRVLAALDEFGLRDNTIVVFWGDHGYHLGEKGKWSKHGSLWEVGLHVPFMISIPGSASNGKVCSRVVECLGLYPTLVELCGLPPAPGQQGASVVPLLRDPSAPWDRPALSVSYQQRILGRSVRTDRWHYADWDYGRAGAMLIDSIDDPGETKNLATDPARAAVIAEMKKTTSNDCHPWKPGHDRSTPSSSRGYRGLLRAEIIGECLRIKGFARRVSGQFVPRHRPAGAEHALLQEFADSRLADIERPVRRGLQHLARNGVMDLRSE